MSAGHAESHGHGASSSPKGGITTAFDCIIEGCMVGASLATGKILGYGGGGGGHDDHHH